MKIAKIDRTEERRILTGMIVDKTVLGRLSSKWDRRGLFKTKSANLIASWCIKYYTKYEDAPMKHIESLYESWASKTRDKDSISLIEKFLSGLSNEYESLQKASNSSYIIDLAGTYFNKVQIEKLSERIKGFLDSDEIEEANEQITSYNKLQLGGGEGINAFQDEEAIKAAFNDKHDPLIKYPGALGKFFQDSLERDAFIAFLAPEKRGKTFVLLDLAYRAMLQKRKVAFFEAGDMSQNQIMRRLMVRSSKCPIKKSIVKVPFKIQRDPDENIADVRFKKKRFLKPLRYEQASKACKQLTQGLGTDETLFKLSCHANSTLSVRMIKGFLQDWEREGWTPDVIVIDYADILNMDSSVFEGRDRINETWKQLRGLSQQYHCLVATATQADAESYNSSLIRRSNFSEDKRKLAHVTGMIGINASPEEQENQIIRFNWVALREGEYSEQNCVHIATCFALSNPAVMSCF